jgi:hypothetical protein
MRTAVTRPTTEDTHLGRATSPLGADQGYEESVRRRAQECGRSSSIFSKLLS